MEKNGVEREAAAAEGVVMFSEEEVREISGFKKGGADDDYVEVTCGCTSHRYGDAVGRLRVFVSGDLEITCECTPGCQEDKLTPAAFEKHSGRETARKWKNNLWVIVNGEKVPLYKTPLLKYYSQALKGANRSHRSQNGRVCHRDEFVHCTMCNKERRFRLRNKDECRMYHDALADENWKCADMPYDNRCYLITKKAETVRGNGTPANLLRCQWNKNHVLVMPPEAAVRVTESHGAHTKA
ncbi:hypothetical protein RHMOL_Rhmol04G0110000 [Rhododendron molle]|uniref:Uncharacterized protein n=2 Tax=Rhododendron molle TaxID=49168 RepID=A0ACC0NZ22_RHOML|nr:hypothetical protein RHMOL_Rhmol04G0110000 [Rhododendron molle]KAI8558619.1 hypothetical protein RHMOL_Rhmol04G0110000 [Rhododendron molle]